MKPEQEETNYVVICVEGTYGLGRDYRQGKDPKTGTYWNVPKMALGQTAGRETESNGRWEESQRTDRPGPYLQSTGFPFSWQGKGKILEHFE